MYIYRYIIMMYMFRIPVKRIPPPAYPSGCWLGLAITLDGLDR